MLRASATDILEIGPDTRFNWIHHVLDLDEVPSKEALARAMSHAVVTWPVLACRYDDSRKPFRWDAIRNFRIEDSLEHVSVGEGDEALHHATVARVLASPSIRQGPPWRLALLVSGPRSRLLVKLHHGCSDAMGGIELVRQIGTVLRGRTPSTPSGPRSVLDLFAAVGSTTRSEMRRSVWRQLGTVRDELGLTKSIPAVGVPQPGPLTDVGVRIEVLAEEDSERIRRRAGLGVGATLIAAATMASLARATEEGKAHAIAGAFLPIDLRRHTDAPRGIANLTGPHVLPLQTSELVDLERATRAVERALEATLARGYAGLGVLTLGELLLPLLPKTVLQKMAHGGVHLPFTNISYLGPLDDVASELGPALQNYAVLPSPRPAFASPPLFVASLRGRLVVGSCWDKTSASDELANRFFSAFRSGLLDDQASRSSTRSETNGAIA